VSFEQLVMLHRQDAAIFRFAALRVRMASAVEGI
jgi:hypothetical protein